MLIKKSIALILAFVLATFSVSPAFAADTVVPAFVSASVNESTLTITYKELLDTSSVPSLSAFKITVAGVARLATAVTIVDATVKITLASPVINGNAVTVAYTKGSSPIQDLAGNDGITLAARAVTNVTPEKIPPVLSTAAINGSLITLTYNENLDAASTPSLSDFTVKVDGVTRAVSAIAISGTTVKITLSSAVLAGQGVQMNYTLGSSPIQDIAGNHAPAFSAKAVTNSTPADKTAPAFASASVNASTLSIVYNESLDASSIPPASAFKVMVNNVARNITSVALSDKTVLLTLASPVVNGNTVTVAYTKGTPPIQDISKNGAITYTAKAVSNSTPETTPPVLSTATINADSILLTYNEALDATSVPGASDFSVMVNGSSKSVTAVTISGATVRLTISEPVISTHTVSVSYTPGSKPIQDVLGNDAVSLTAKSVTNSTPKDAIAPVFSSANVDIDTLTIVYNERLDPASIPPASAFKVMVNNVARNVFNVNISGTNVVLTLSGAVSNGNTVTVAYTKGVLPIQDLTGNDAVTFTAKTVKNNTPADNIAPVLSTAVVNGSVMTLTYSENIDTTSVPSLNAFLLQVDSVIVTPSNVSISGNKITLTLSTGVRHGAEVRLGYTKDAQPIRDFYNNQATSFSALEATNLTTDNVSPVLQSATVDTALLTLTYDEPLDIASVPSPYNYTVMVNGVSRTPTSVSVTGNAVTLILSPAVASTETVTIAYSGTTVQDIAGNDAATFTTTTVANNTPDTTAPILQSAIAVDGILTLTFNEALDALSVPSASNFTISGGHAVTMVTISVSSVVLQISPAVQPGEMVTISYILNPNLGPIQDAFGNDTSGLVNAAVTNATVDTTAPTVVSSALEKANLVMTLSEPLDEQSIPQISQFSVTVQGQIIPLSEVKISGNLVTLTLTKPALANHVVTLNYNPSIANLDNQNNPSNGNNLTNPLQDKSGNDLAAITGVTVTNTTPALPRVPKWSRYIYLGGQKVATVQDEQDPYTGNISKKTIIHLTDHLGGSNIDTNTNGEVLQITDYLPFGSERIVLNPSSPEASQGKENRYKNKYRFIGKERDKESDLLYVEARYYDSDLGRFISQDPVFWEVGITKRGKKVIQDPQVLNSYSYSKNNPIMYSDKTGQIPDPTDAATGFCGPAIAVCIIVKEAVEYALIASLVADGFTEDSAIPIPGPADEIVEVAEDAKKAEKSLDPVENLPKGENIVNTENITKLSPYELTPLHPTDKKTLEKVRDSIQQSGEIKESIKYVDDGANKYIVDGHHRTRAAKELNILEVPAEQVDVPYKAYRSWDEIYQEAMY